ncbi:uncharacterized protein LOC125089033 [Lutra lutra]|uniref:uncharacterized protein LOC125089033 n=1 Tax=Lutra lutra TaxID=9657 RepID=UPI001FD30C1B|nr:uncharacterized protein LOC125089033 [Lutra lutra]
MAIGRRGQAALPALAGGGTKVAEARAAGQRGRSEQQLASGVARGAGDEAGPALSISGPRSRALPAGLALARGGGGREGGREPQQNSSVVAVKMAVAAWETQRTSGSPTHSSFCYETHGAHWRKLSVDSCQCSRTGKGEMLKGLVLNWRSRHRGAPQRGPRPTAGPAPTHAPLEPPSGPGSLDKLPAQTLLPPQTGSNRSSPPAP